jgi:hypothetical protein
MKASGQDRRRVPRATAAIGERVHKTFHKTVYVSACIALAACGSLPTGSKTGASSAGPAAADATPAVSTALPTAVQVVAVSSDGIAGFFPFESLTTTSTRADMQRNESAVKGTGTVSRFLMPNTATAAITRLDRKLVYGLNIPRGEYTECPLTGCPVPAAEPRRDPEQPREPQPAREPGCTMKVATNSFDVKPTGQRKAINGFDTERYSVDWTVALEDPKKRRSTLKLAMDFWTTAVTPPMREAMAIEANYVRSAVSAAQQQAGAAGAAALPPQLVETMSRYFAQSMSAAERNTLFNVARQMERVKGQPITSEFKLFFRGDACGGMAQDGGAGGASGSGGVAGLLGGLLGSRPAGDAGAERPLLSFTHEVKSWRVEPVRDSAFAPPPQFKRSNPR